MTEQENQEQKPIDKAQEYKRLQSWLKKLIPNDWDKYDLKSAYDPKLEYLEMKNIIRAEVSKLFMKKDDLKERAAQALAEQEKLEHEAKMKAEAEVEEYNKQLLLNVPQSVEKYYQPIYRAVDKICKGYSNLLFVKGIGGTGKSYSIRKTLTDNHAEYFEVAGEVTEAYLYRLLYTNNGKIIWLKDVATLLTGLKSINILKAATETEDSRILTKNNYSKNQDDLPDRFVCKCKFIFDYNNISTHMRDDFEALVSRGDFLEFALSAKELQHIMREIAKDPEAKEVTEFVIQNFKGSGLVRLNLRTQWKAINTYKYAVSQGLEWKEEIKNELQRVGKVRALLYSLIGNEAVRRVDLKRLLLKHELVTSVRMAEIRIQEWLFTEELYSHSPIEDRNGFVALQPK